MKHLLNGVAVAAVLALATPVFAQNAPMTPSTPPTAAPAPAPKTTSPAPKTMTTSTAPMKPMAKKPMHHPMHHVVSYQHMNSGDQMTDQLNQQELQRLQSGAPSIPAPASPPSNYQTPGKPDIAPR
jgi:hypothetical protein